MPSATGTLATIMGSVITTTVDLLTTVITTYWPFILILGVLAALVGYFGRAVHIGTKK